jgi:amidase
MRLQETRRGFCRLAGAGLATLTASALGSDPARPAESGADTSYVANRSASDMEYRSTRELVAMLAARRISSRELLDDAIARIERFDPRINAVVVRDFARARDAAAAADAALARGERRPLLGIPMTVKEAYDVAGLPTTWGIPAFRGWMPPEDAVAVARLKAAGAVIIGKTNVPVALGDWQSYNEIYGTTNNPWDVTRTPGGSSGGSAAALAAGYVSLEIGSDLGGSIRAPAAFCGVYGHKSSYGLIPLDGHVPPPHTEAAGGDGDLPVLGPLARSAADLALALDVLAGPDEREATAWRLALPPARHDTLREFRVLVIDAHPLLPTSDVVRNALHDLADRLAKSGAAVSREPDRLPAPSDSARIYMHLLVSFATQGESPDFLLRMKAVVAGLPEGDDSLAASRARGTILSHRDWLADLGQRSGIRRQWRALFRDHDVVICPIMPTLAFPHDHEPQETRRIEVDGKLVPYMDQLVWPGVATLPGLPATSVPIGRAPSGLPIGVQIIGPFLEDRTTIALAALLEREYGGFVAPPDFA